MHEGGTPPVKAGIVGVSGYSGVELSRLLSRHPSFQLVFAATNRWAGKRLGNQVPIAGPAADVVCTSQEASAPLFAGCDVIFLCTPHEASMEIAPARWRPGRGWWTSGAFRLAAAEYPGWYGFAHGNPDLLAQAVYSMPEATGNKDRLRQARLVANPGCYPTASSLAVLPLLQAGSSNPTSSSSTPRAGRPAPDARGARSSRSPRSPTASARTGSVGTSTRPRSSGCSPWQGWPGRG